MSKFHAHKTLLHKEQWDQAVEWWGEEYVKKYYVLAQRLPTADFCRSCRGKGYMTSAPGEVEPRCRYCDGTGRQTTLVLGTEEKNHVQG